MMPKRWHAIGLAVGVGVVSTLTVGASLGPDSIGFWTGEQLTLVLQRPLPDTMCWRLTEGVTVAVMALPGLVLALGAERKRCLALADQRHVVLLLVVSLVDYHLSLWLPATVN